MTSMTREQAVSVLRSAADVRAQQWRGLANGTSPADLIDELYEASENEADLMATEIENALGDERETRPPTPSYATPEQVAAARRRYCRSSEEDIEIDEMPAISQGEEGHWVAAWVWMADPADEENEEDF